VILDGRNLSAGNTFLSNGQIPVALKPETILSVEKAFGKA